MKGMAQHLNRMKKKGMIKSAKMGKVMSEYKHGTIHSGSKDGPIVRSRAQAVAIGISESRKAAKGSY